jgi:HAD superfamily hydrolase (TIGR01509 family)
MDGVIIDSGDVHLLAWEKTLAEFNVPLGRHFFETNHGSSSKDFAEHYIREYKLKTSAAFVAELKKKNYLQLLDDQIKLINNVDKTIQKLSKKYLLAVATSENTETTLKVLTKFQLKKFFKSIVTADSVTKTKPNPDVFLKVAQLLNIVPNQCIVIEDSIHGITAAKRAGMKVIGITTNFSREKLSKADLIIDSFDELDLKQI